MTESIRESKVRFERSTPLLNSGDVLDHDEYIRRYEAAPETLRAERIERTVYLMNSLRARNHGNPHALLIGWLFTYAMHDPDLVVTDNATLFLNTDNDPQPDGCMYREGGTANLDDEGYLNGPPEMIVEVAASSASYDLGKKRNVYEDAGVGEYLVYESSEQNVFWWYNQRGKFEDVPCEDGILKSQLFPGLWLHIDAMKSANANLLIKTLRLRQGMESR